jgi:hypothetical protein
MKKSSTPKKRYWEMTANELAEATKEFDRTVPLSKTRPLTKAERALFTRMQKAPHRSIFVTRDPNGVWVRLDPKLLARTTQYAAKRKLSLSEVISRSLKGMLAIVE